MGRVLARVREAVANGVAASVVAAREALGDVDVVARDLSDRDGAIAAAEAAWASMERAASGAFVRYPQFHDVGVHGGDTDPRAMQLLATPAYIERAGMYAPSDLTAMTLDGRASEVWAAREALRLTAFLVVVEGLIAEMDEGRLPATAYADAVAGVAREFGAMTVAAGG